MDAAVCAEPVLWVMNVLQPVYVRISRALMIRAVALEQRVLRESVNAFHSAPTRCVALMDAAVCAVPAVVERSASLMVSVMGSKRLVPRAVPASKHVSAQGLARLIVLACALLRMGHRLGMHSTNGLLVS